jgi:DNA-binding MarR family transcriptional regulator
MSSSARSIARQILQLMPIIMRTVSSELRRGSHYVTPSHLGLLATLARGPSTLSRLSEILAVSLPTMSNSITTFVHRGWVKRKQAADDRRFVTIELTAKGWKALEDIRNRAEMLLETQLAPLSKARCEKLGAALRILEGSFQNQTENSNDDNLRKTKGAPPN